MSAEFSASSAASERPDLRAQTGRQVWLQQPPDSPFEEKAVPETVYLAEAPVGRQSGTYFKTSLQKDGMTIWRWGGVHPDDLARGVAAS